MFRRLLPHALVLLSALLACWPAVHGSFVYDDEYYVVQNPAVSGDASPWTTPLGDASQALWRPLTVATFAAQWDGSGDATPFRAANLALHVLVAWTLLEIGLALGLGMGGSLAAALLFAVHPVHAEAVAWASGRAELLAALCVLLAWRAHLSSATGAPLAAAVLLAAGLLSKENAALAPLLFMLVDRGRRNMRPIPWRRLAWLGVVVLAILVARFAVLPQALPGDTPFGDLSLPNRALVAMNILGRACLLLVWPEPLRVFYPRHDFTGMHALLLSAAVAWLVLTAGLRRRQPLASAACLCVPVALLTVLNLVPIGATFAERFLYLPSAFACLGAGALLAARGRTELRSGNGLGLSVLLPSLAVLVAVPVCRNATAVFRDDLSLWAHAAAVAPEVPHARYNHGYFLDAAGRHSPEDRDRPGAADELAESLRLDPGHRYAGYAHQILGNLALQGEGRRLADPTAAARHYRAALDSVPGLAEARINLASLALSAPMVVDRDEALDLLTGVNIASGATPEQRQAAQLMRLRLLEPPALEAGAASGADAAPEQAAPPDPAPPPGP